MSKEPQSMKDLVADFSGKLVPFKEGDVTEVKIMELGKSRILVDVAGFCLGIIPEKEMLPEFAELKPGDKVLAYVLMLENQDGYCVLSLKRADKERVTKILEEKFTSGDVLTVKCHDANRGGLLCAFGEYEGFLPVSQLSSSHYPKVGSGDKDEILGKLRQLVNQNLQVKILSFEPQNNKLIFSEKAAGDLVQQEKIKSYQIGQTIEGTVTGVVDFGLFVNLGEVEGLVHISEVSWEHVDNLTDLYKPGDKVKVQIISLENNRLSLSIKRLLPDPWLTLVKSYKAGDIVEGKITRTTPFGAFVSFDGLDGLVHISEMGEKVSNPNDVVEVGKTYKFKIVTIEPELHKLNLSMKDLDEKKKAKEDKKDKEEKTEKEEKPKKAAKKTTKKADKKEGK
jgi:small subunit ribosomal protein S1